ncbi:unnamed protein product [Coregonus sp. 'balchen']|nr:unnamed protein product [Coregonus sp. 'balchen']
MDVGLVQLESSLWVGKKRYRAALTGLHLNWTELDKKNRDKTVSEVVGVEEGRVEVLPQRSVSEDTDRDFTVFYVKRSSSGSSYGLLWHLGRTQFSCPSRDLRDQWMTLLRIALKTHSSSRPHRLLVFINPFGGKKQGRQIYHSLVAPLFELAGISAHVIVTERANQARDHILKKDLTGFDGVVCVGGDGMFSELLHGVIGRTQQEAGLSEHDPSLQSCDLHIGIIPAGSTDCVCFATVGVNDPVTSALHIIIGDSQPLDVCSVHHRSSLVRYSVSLVGYGFYGDVLAESERHRWMGPLRYDYSGLVQYLPADHQLSSPRDNTRCLSGCRVCFKSTGRLFPHSPDASSNDSSHFSQFSSDSEVPWGCPPQHTWPMGQFDLPFVDVHRVKAVRFSLPPGEKEEERGEERETVNDGGMVEEGETPSQSGSQHHLVERGEERGMANDRRKKKDFLCGLCCSKPSVSVWNCDGEILPHTEILCRVHGQLVRLYARGMEDGSATPTRK